MTDPLQTRRREQRVIEIPEIDIIGDPMTAQYDKAPPPGEISLEDIEILVNQNPVTETASGMRFRRQDGDADSSRVPSRRPTPQRQVSVGPFTPQYAGEAQGEQDVPALQRLAESALGRPRYDARRDTTDWELPEWLGESLADGEGNISLAALAARALGGVPEQPAEEQTAAQRTVDPTAVALGAADAMTFGNADNIAGALSESTGEQLRDETERARADNPGGFDLGAGAGMVSQMIVPGAASARGLGRGARLGAAVAEGAVTGGAYGYGQSDADTVGGRLTDAAGPALLGGAMGGALQGAANRYSRRAAEAAAPEGQAAIRRGVERAESDAARHRLAQGGISRLSDQDQALTGATHTDRARSARQTADTLREAGVFEGIGPFPPSRSTIQERIGAMRDDASEELAAVRQMMQGADVDVGSVGRHLDERIAHYEGQGGVQSDALARRLRQERAALDRTRQHAPGADPATMPWDTLQGRRTTHRRATNPNSDNLGQTERAGLYRAETEAQQAAAESAGVGERYAAARRRFRAGESLEQSYERGAARDAANRQVSPTDNYAAGVGMITGGAPGALTGWAVNRGIRAAEHPVRAAMAERAARRLAESPERFGRWASRLQTAANQGRRPFAAALYLAQQQDPQVRQALREDAGQAPQAQPQALDDFFLPDEPQTLDDFFLDEEPDQ